MTKPTAAEVAAMVERLRSNEPLPVCPYDPKSPDYFSTDDDAPCVICGTENDPNAPNKCRGADTRVMAEAADMLTALQPQDAASVEDDNLIKALKKAEWFNVSIGNKWLIAGAIQALTTNANRIAELTRERDEAVEAEREACAKVAERYELGPSEEPCTAITAAIRARKP
jgi:hypothetical protein